MCFSLIAVYAAVYDMGRKNWNASQVYNGNKGDHREANVVVKGMGGNWGPASSFKSQAGAKLTILTEPLKNWRFFFNADINKFHLRLLIVPL